MMVVAVVCVGGGVGGRKRGRVAALKKAVPAAGLVVVVAMELAALKLPCAGVDADLRARASVRLLGRTSAAWFSSLGRRGSRTWSRR